MLSENDKPETWAIETGSLNELVKSSMAHLAADDVSLFDVSCRLNEMPLSALSTGGAGYGFARDSFMAAAMSWTADEHTVRLPATLIQPIAAADVAQAVADVSAGAPLQGTRNVAGPEVFTLDELGRITLAAHGDKRTVVIDNSAGMFAAAEGDALLPKDGAIIAKTTYREWLAR
jgi:uncharacterized protein YbjT (DUF2867 family)